MERQEKGSYAEREACKFLRGSGYRIIEKNFRFGKQEIDIIALEKEILVFIEVRARGIDGLVSPEESIGIWKQKNIIRTAQYFLQKKGCHDMPCRFDVVTVLYNGNKIQKIDLIKDAFQVGG